MPAPAAAEAARYALLRRLAPSMRHHLVVPLQPIGMIYEIMDRRLRAPEPNYADVQEGAHKINNYARAALASCLDVITWLAPDEKARTTAAEGLRECLLLVQTGFTFRGFALRDELGEAQGEVSRAAFRNVVTGALFQVTDEQAPPAELVLTGEAAHDALVIRITWTPVKGDPGFSTAPGYRPITRDDLDALAVADSVAMQREDGCLSIRLPWVLASA